MDYQEEVEDLKRELARAYELDRDRLRCAIAESSSELWNFVLDLLDQLEDEGDEIQVDAANTFEIIKAIVRHVIDETFDGYISKRSDSRPGSGDSLN